MGPGRSYPAGTSGRVHENLEQVEPRVDLAQVAGDAASEIVIDAPGSYYLSANLEVGKTTGVRIIADDVSVDLNGFHIVRVSGTLGEGISIEDGYDRIRVRNGSIRGFNHGIQSGTRPSPAGCLFENLAVSDFSHYGVQGGVGTHVLNCRVHSGGGFGIDVRGGSLVTDCTVHDIDGDGIRVSHGYLVEDNQCSNNGTSGGDGAAIHAWGIRNRIVNNQAVFSDRGIQVGQGPNLIVRNTCSNNATNYVIDVDNQVGEIVVAPNSPAISGSTGGSGVGTTDPWANFSF